MVAGRNPFLFLKHRFHILHFPNSTGFFTKPTGCHHTKYQLSPDIAPEFARHQSVMNGYDNPKRPIGVGLVLLQPAPMLAGERGCWVITVGIQHTTPSRVGDFVFFDMNLTTTHLVATPLLSMESAMELLSFTATPVGTLLLVEISLSTRNRRWNTIPVNRELHTRHLALKSAIFVKSIGFVKMLSTYTQITNTKCIWAWRNFKNRVLRM